MFTPWVTPTTGSIPDNGLRVALPKASPPSWAKMDPPDVASYFPQDRYPGLYDKRLTAAQQKWNAEMKPYRGRKVVTYDNCGSNLAHLFG